MISILRDSIDKLIDRLYKPFSKYIPIPLRTLRYALSSIFLFFVTYNFILRKENPDFLELLAQCLDQYQAHIMGFCDRGHHGFINFEIKNSQLCYFFVSRPDLHLFLDNLLTKRDYPSGYGRDISYMECYF
jgi:hypothetical protein